MQSPEGKPTDYEQCDVHTHAGHIEQVVLDCSEVISSDPNDIKGAVKFNGTYWNLANKHCSGNLRASKRS